VVVANKASQDTVRQSVTGFTGTATGLRPTATAAATDCALTNDGESSRTEAQRPKPRSHARSFKLMRGSSLETLRVSLQRLLLLARYILDTPW
jgi:hypothetical protein